MFGGHTRTTSRLREKQLGQWSAGRLERKKRSLQLIMATSHYYKVQSSETDEEAVYPFETFWWARNDL